MLAESTFSYLALLTLLVLVVNLLMAFLTRRHDRRPEA